MSDISLDLSGRTELGWVGELVRPIQGTAIGARIFIVGTMARELVLVHGFGVHRGRVTRDLDFAVRVVDWTEYGRLRDSLVINHDFSPVDDVRHRLTSPEGMELDVLPFGAVEPPQRPVLWSPDGQDAMSILGFAEVADNAVAVTLPGEVHIDVADPAGQTLPKLVAWSERGLARRGSNAYDPAILLRNYLDTGQDGRLYEEAADVLDDPDFGREIAGATLLGRDIRRLLDDD